MSGAAAAERRYREPENLVAAVGVALGKAHEAGDHAGHAALAALELDLAALGRLVEPASGQRGLAMQVAKLIRQYLSLPDGRSAPPRLHGAVTEAAAVSLAEGNHVAVGQLHAIELAVLDARRRAQAAAQTLQGDARELAALIAEAL
jgi:hypothetical protein